MPDSVLYREWFDKAADDELSAQVVVEEGAPSTACFLAQQYGSSGSRIMSQIVCVATD